MPVIRKARTVTVVKILRRFGPLKRRARMPKQLQPDGVRREYFAALQPFVRVAQQEFARVRGEILSLLTEERATEAADHMDASGGSGRARGLVDRAAARAAAAFDPKDIRALAVKMGKRTSAFQQAQIDKQVRSAFGVPLTMLEAPITAKLEGFAATNVELIKSVSSRYFDRLRLDVTDAFESGMHPDTLADLFIERDGMAENDATRIARDQIGKLNGQLNEERQTAMGVTGYIWRTSNDERVRDEHSAREGQHFDWNDPPEDGHPGEPIQCRCFAEPDLGPILAAIE